MAKPKVLWLSSFNGEIAAAAQSGLGEAGELIQVGTQPLAQLASQAAAAITMNPLAEVGLEGLKALKGLEFLQTVSAGVDHLPFLELPADLLIASNPGAYGEPMADHAMAMILALAKRLRQVHNELARGKFNQMTESKDLAGKVLAILGFGGIGQAIARRGRAFGMQIYAVNTSGCTDQPVDWVGTLQDLEAVLHRADVVVLSLPLTKQTRGLLGERELNWLKPSAILVNVARGAIIDQDALFAHLLANPDFQAGIDAWWVEPFGSDKFELRHPFLELENVLGSPHNSGMVPGALQHSAYLAGQNVARFLRGQPILGRVNPELYL